jgi:hypothetical protein
MPLNEKEAAALERLEQERARRTAEKVQAGEAVRLPPLIVGAPESIDAVRTATLAALRAAGERRKILYDIDDECVEVIITGVPRAGREPDSYSPPNVPLTPTPSICEGRSAPRHPVSEPRDQGQPTAQKQIETPRAENPMRRVRTQVERPSRTNPGGAIAEGLYRVEGDTVEVTDMDGRLVGRAPIKTGDDPEVTARKILREKRASDFYAPIRYH